MSYKLALSNVSKKFIINKADNLSVLDNINMTVNNNEFVTIIGASGCGKSTILRLISGLDNEFEGSILIDGNNVLNSDYLISYMQQKDLLMPWRKVIDNVILPLELKGKNKKAIKEEALKLFPEFGLEGFENSYPNQLSGGMKQRAALLRTFFTPSDIMLLDEPFGALDAITRENLQDWLLNIWNLHKKTVLFITHDIDEAIYLSDKVYVLSERPGQVVCELPIEFERPRNKEIIYSSRYLGYKKKLKESLYKK